MGSETPRSNTAEVQTNILGIPKNSSLKEICKAYRSLVTKWHPDHKKSDYESECSPDNNHSYTATHHQRQEERSSVFGEEPTTPERFQLPRKFIVDEGAFSRPLELTKSASRRSHTPTPSSLSRNASRRSPSPMDNSRTKSKSTTRGSSIPSTPTTPKTPDHFSSSPVDLSRSKSKSTTRGSSIPSTPRTPTTPPTVFPASLSKCMSKRGYTPIIFSQSTARKKPPPIERKLECSLEELCRGCIKKIKVTRDVINNVGLIVQEEEILKIKVRPGWKKGTKITFEGKGDERPGSLPADIIFSIEEKKHQLFKRAGDDLEIGVEIPLVQSLTGCSLSVPLLGGETMHLFIDDVIYPGYEKVIRGQGMPIPKEPSRRGNLRISFFVMFPTELTDQQRSDAYNILRDVS